MRIRSMFRRTLIVAALCVPTVFLVTEKAHAGIFISVGFAPPVLPVYTQPICPNPGFIWTPGYWAYGGDGYYWVPGVWVEPPTVGLLWTPAYWGWENNAYLFHAGYWGPHVGFYGRINYGFGYTGAGSFGGEWRGGAFFYNRSVANVNVTNVTNVYNRTVIVNNHTTVALQRRSGRRRGAADVAGDGVQPREPHRADGKPGKSSRFRRTGPCAVCFRKPRSSGRAGGGLPGLVPGEPDQRRGSGSPFCKRS